MNEQEKRAAFWIVLAIVLIILWLWICAGTSWQLFS